MDLSGDDCRAVAEAARRSPRREPDPPIATARAPASSAASALSIFGTMPPSNVPSASRSRASEASRRAIPLAGSARRRRTRSTFVTMTKASAPSAPAIAPAAVSALMLSACEPSRVAPSGATTGAKPAREQRLEHLGPDRDDLARRSRASRREAAARCWAASSAPSSPLIPTARTSRVASARTSALFTFPQRTASDHAPASPHP